MLVLEEQPILLSGSAGSPGARECRQQWKQFVSLDCLGLAALKSTWIQILKEHLKVVLEQSLVDLKFLGQID